MNNHKSLKIVKPLKNFNFLKTARLFESDGHCIDNNVLLKYFDIHVAGNIRKQLLYVY